MNTTVHALEVEIGRASKRVEAGRPDRADVEDAFRTIADLRHLSSRRPVVELALRDLEESRDRRHGAGRAA